MISVKMIIKEKDSSEFQLQELTQALQGQLSDQERRNLERDRALFLAGIEGEKEAAYHIDFKLKDNKNWMVIHDLRLEWNGRVAQIDHLLIDRFMEAYVVESKNFKTKVRYANGGWERFRYDDWEGIPCPVEQNCRHIAVLTQLIEAQKLAPVRLGLSIPLDFLNVVLVNPACSIVGDAPKGARIFRMDSFISKIRDDDPSFFSPLKIVSAETIREFGTKLVGYHKPAAIRKVPAAPVSNGRSAEVTTTRKTPTATVKNDTSVCESCHGPVSREEAYFCRMSKDRFAGAILCRKCQSFAPKTSKPAVHRPRALDTKGPCDVIRSMTMAPMKTNDQTGIHNTQEIETVAHCAQCGAGVDKKVVAFCRFSSRKFAGRILCRECQR